MGAERQIVAWGGAVSKNPDENAPMLDYILKQSGKDRPRVCITGPGAEETAQGYQYLSAFSRFDCRLSHLSLFRQPMPDFEELVLGNDVVYVGGGNPRSMLALWREYELDRILRLAWERGVVLAGVSAGAICWFEEILTQADATGRRNGRAALGLLPGSCVPHYNSTPGLSEAYHDAVSQGRVKGGYAIDDGAALHFVGTELRRVVTLRDDVTAYRIDADHGSIRKERLEAELLLADEGLGK